ncbi:MAG: hypothetical protein OEZ58_03145 [Gammaproteobacteria bacterium]|nr:hypothetical protein [Gammaproteobacteria bacterium]MDH5727958.1 hypothetical protein [Gammaproteobacteria bacterium]
MSNKYNAYNRLLFLAFLSFFSACKDNDGPQGNENNIFSSPKIDVSIPSEIEFGSTLTSNITVLTDEPGQFIYSIEYGPSGMTIDQEGQINWEAKPLMVSKEQKVNFGIAIETESGLQTTGEFSTTVLDNTREAPVYLHNANEWNFRNIKIGNFDEDNNLEIFIQDAENNLIAFEKKENTYQFDWSVPYAFPTMTSSTNQGIASHFYDVNNDNILDYFLKKSNRDILVVDGQSKLPIKTINIEAAECKFEISSITDLYQTGSINIITAATTGFCIIDYETGAIDKLTVDLIINPMKISSITQLDNDESLEILLWDGRIIDAATLSQEYIPEDTDFFGSTAVDYGNDGKQEVILIKELPVSNGLHNGPFLIQIFSLYENQVIDQFESDFQMYGIDSDGDNINDSIIDRNFNYFNNADLTQPVSFRHDSYTAIHKDYPFFDNYFVRDIDQDNNKELVFFGEYSSEPLLIFDLEEKSFEQKNFSLTGDYSKLNSNAPSFYRTVNINAPNKIHLFSSYQSDPLAKFTIDPTTNLLNVTANLLLNKDSEFLRFKNIIPQCPEALCYGEVGFFAISEYRKSSFPYAEHYSKIESITQSGSWSGELVTEKLAEFPDQFKMMKQGKLNLVREPSSQVELVLINSRNSLYVISLQNKFGIDAPQLVWKGGVVVGEPKDIFFEDIDDDGIKEIIVISQFSIKVFKYDLAGYFTQLHSISIDDIAKMISRAVKNISTGVVNKRSSAMELVVFADNDNTLGNNPTDSYMIRFNVTDFSKISFTKLEASINSIFAVTDENSSNYVISYKAKTSDLNGNAKFEEEKLSVFDIGAGKFVQTFPMLVGSGEISQNPLIDINNDGKNELFWTTQHGIFYSK